MKAVAFIVVCITTASAVFAQGQTEKERLAAAISPFAEKTAQGIVEEPQALGDAKLGATTTTVEKLFGTPDYQGDTNANALLMTMQPDRRYTFYADEKVAMIYGNGGRLTHMYVGMSENSLGLRKSPPVEETEKAKDEAMAADAEFMKRFSIDAIIPLRECGLITDELTYAVQIARRTWLHCHDRSGLMECLKLFREQKGATGPFRLIDMETKREYASYGPAGLKIE